MDIADRYLFRELCLPYAGAPTVIYNCCNFQ